MSSGLKHRFKCSYTCCFYLGLVIVLLTFPSASQDAANSSDQLISSIINIEGTPESGQVTVKVDVADLSAFSGLKSEFRSEAAATDELRFWWSTDKRFRIEVRSQGQVKRVIIGDGKRIDTGKQIWDARFMTRGPGSGRWNKQYDRLQHTFIDQMWPYNIMLGRHLWPLSDRLRFPELLSRKYVAKMQKEPGEETDRLFMLLEFKGTTLPPRKFALVPCGKGYSIVSNRFPENRTYGIMYERSNPVSLGNIGCVSITCQVWMTPGDLPSFTTTISDINGEHVSQDFFDVTSGGNTVQWPNGSWFGDVLAWISRLFD